MSKKDHCPSCGLSGMKPFTKRDFTARCKHVAVEVRGLSGHECVDANCKEIVFEGASTKRYAAASDKAVALYRGERLREIRLKLGLTQLEMIRKISGGGHNAISRYENGEVCVPTPLWVLLGLLEKRPELINEIRVTF